jgi:hypothetical protein|tara:strand:+ start:139 stop:1812 length:1674 start_codon:yes stop_codon:yes gene_type:complete
MAVVQISRIQIRRGQKNLGSGLPQLASGEFGWAVDTQELYIGNGSVAEGSPAVGNTKLLTQYDDIFALADTYTYRQADAFMLTGGSVESPTRRSLQARLDDRISVRSFGLTGVVSQVATTKLQAAIDQLYLNDAIKGSEQSRVILHLEPGIYVIDSTIHIPPYATLVGAGADKTIIRTTTASTTMFDTVNSSSIVGTPASNASTTTLNQPTNIRLEGITLETTVPNKALVLNNCKDSKFKDVKFKGPWVSGAAVATTDVAVEMNSLSGTVETKNNIFEECTYVGFSYAVISDWDIHNNIWKSCNFNTLSWGLTFAPGLVTLDSADNSGKESGPYNNRWNSCNFNNINKSAVYIKFGKGNVSSDNYYTMVGTSGAAEHLATDSVIKYSVPGNSSLGDYFARTAVLSYTPGYWTNNAYLPEIEGAVTAEFGETHVLNSITQGAAQKRFRLPGEVDIASQQFDIDYILSSRNYSATRTGTLTLNVNGQTKAVTLSDSFDYTGLVAYEDVIKFSALVQDADSDATQDSIDVLVASAMPGDDLSQLEFKIRNRKTIIDATGE